MSDLVEFCLSLAELFTVVSLSAQVSVLTDEGRKLARACAPMAVRVLEEEEVDMRQLSCSTLTVERLWRR